MSTLLGFYLFSWSYSHSSKPSFEVDIFWLSWVLGLIFSLRWLIISLWNSLGKIFRIHRLLSLLFCSFILHMSLLYVMLFAYVIYSFIALLLTPKTNSVLVLLCISFNWQLVRCALPWGLVSKFCPTSYHLMHALLSVLFCAFTRPLLFPW